MKLKVLTSAVVLAAAILLPVRVMAAPVTFFGEDLGLGEATRLPSHPNADTARTNFFANLVGVGTENFEGFASGTLLPLNVSFGAVGTATLTGSGDVANVPTGTNGVGRYPISGNQYVDTDSALVLTFTNPVAAFGFYGIDIGDFDGQITLTTNGATPLILNVGNTVSGMGGSVLYYGFYVTSASELFTSITFGNTAPGVDFFGFDDFSIGSLEQVRPVVPEPTSMLLLGTGLVGLARRRARKNS